MCSTNELKREYQEWLHERDRDRDDYDGHPDRDEAEIADWALEHDLPSFDEQVHFPDLRIEYEEIDGRRDHEVWRSSPSITGARTARRSHGRASVVMAAPAPVSWPERRRRTPRRAR